MSVPRVLLVAVAVVVVVGIGVALWLIGPGPMAFASGPKVPLASYGAASPTGVPPELASASLVQRGEYLAKAADCMVCHTAPGGQPYAGGFAFTLPFGVLYSTNITPDRETGIGAYGDADFLKAMHEGVRRDGARLYPAMPFTSYTYMTDADALAIKAYLFSLPPVRAPARPNSLAFPFNQRVLMAFWSLAYNPNRRFEPVSSQSPEWNRGAYLAEALAHCGDCHTPRNLAFALDNRRKFGGALTAGWRAYNISSDKGTGVGAWSDDEVFSYLSNGHATGHGTASGPMGEAVDNSFSQMTPSDVRAMAAYLRSVPPHASHDLPATLAAPASASHRDGPQVADARGKQVFEGACASCHSWTGVSPIAPTATLTGARAVNDPSAVNVAQVVLLGGARRTPQGTLAMPAFGDAYSDAEIAAVANYVTARFGSKPSSITEKQVADLRKQTAQE
jgi:mono/diheme cytochrome c family protein